MYIVTFGSSGVPRQLLFSDGCVTMEWRRWSMPMMDHEKGANYFLVLSPSYLFSFEIVNVRKLVIYII